MKKRYLLVTTKNPDWISFTEEFVTEDSKVSFNEQGLYLGGKCLRVG